LKNKFHFHFVASALTVFSLCVVGNAAAEDHRVCVISESGIGNIRLGMTINDAKKAMPDANFERTSDGDGASLIAVHLGEEILMILDANEDSPDAPINWTNKIEFIETFNSSCKTREGIHPGLLITEAERKLGKTQEIVESEIESRQFIQFKHQSRHLIFRINYTGIFAEDSHKTTKFNSNGKIFSIAVAANQ